MTSYRSPTVAMWVCSVKSTPSWNVMGQQLRLKQWLIRHLGLKRILKLMRLQSFSVLVACWFLFTNRNQPVHDFRCSLSRPFLVKIHVWVDDWHHSPSFPPSASFTISLPLSQGRFWYGYRLHVLHWRLTLMLLLANNLMLVSHTLVGICFTWRLYRCSVSDKLTVILGKTWWFRVWVSCFETNPWDS